jgi:hypothetical protein
MHQFIHIEVFSESVSKKAVSRQSKSGKSNNSTKSRLSVREVIAEAKREPSACHHVISPEPPTKIYGIDLDDVERLAIASKTNQKDKIGKKLRIETPILLGGVTSYPKDEYQSNPNKFYLWLDAVVAWIKNEYGDNLKNITLHLDEENPHIHFYVISPIGRVKSLHPGYQADCLVDPKDSIAKMRAYKEAMRLFQNRYHSDVSSRFGMLRLGQGKQRKTRAEYLADKANAKLLACKIQEIEHLEQVATKNATDKSNLIFNEAKIKTENMLSKTRKEVKLMNEEALRWTKNSIENMRKLKQAEAKVNTLDEELKYTKEALDYFVKENQELQSKLSVRRTTL